MILISDDGKYLKNIHTGECSSKLVLDINQLLDNWIELERPFIIYRYKK